MIRLSRATLPLDESRIIPEVESMRRLRFGPALDGPARAGGTGAAIETADIALMTDDHSKLPWLLRHSRHTRNVIIQNISLSLGVKAVFLVLAIPGLANLWMAIAADMGASLLVTLNGLRLLRSTDRDIGAVHGGT